MENFQENNQQSQKGNNSNKWVKLLVLFFGLSLISSVFIIMDKQYCAVSDTMIDGSPAIFKTTKNTIGWVKVRGVIMEDGGSGWSSSNSASALATRIKKMGENKDIKAIVIDIDSPGGTVASVQDIYNAIMSVRKEHEKPVIALFRDVAASGGYYIAMACDKIIAQPGTITGSIGVIMQTTNMQELFAKIGVKIQPIKSGKYKDIGSPYREMTDEGKQLIQAMIDDSYQQFYQVVKTNRQLTDKVLKNYADGRVFTGRQAYNMKMVDYLGGEEKVKTIAEELTGLDNLEIGHQRPSNFKDLFLMLEYAKFNGKNSITKSIEKITTPKVLYLWTY